MKNKKLYRIEKREEEKNYIGQKKEKDEIFRSKQVIEELEEEEKNKTKTQYHALKKLINPKLKLNPL